MCPQVSSYVRSDRDLLSAENTRLYMHFPRLHPEPVRRAVLPLQSDKDPPAFLCLRQSRLPWYRPTYLNTS